MGLAGFAGGPHHPLHTSMEVSTMSTILALALVTMLLLAACVPGGSSPSPIDGPGNTPTAGPATLPPVASDGPGKASPSLEIPPPP
jgi:hypothetical protein